MRKTRRRPSQTAVFIACAIGCALVVWGAFSFLGAPLEPVGERISLWDYDDPGEWEVYEMENGERRELRYEGGGAYGGLSSPGETFFASAVLEPELEDALLELNSGYAFALFLDGDLFYTMEPGGKARLEGTRMRGIPNPNAMPFYVSLPADYAGRTLTVAQAQLGLEKGEDPFAGEEETDNQVFLGPVSLLDQTRLDSELTSAMGRASYQAIGLTAVGLLFLASFLYSAYAGAPDISAAFFCGFVFLWMAGQFAAQTVLQPYYSRAAPFQAFFVHLSMACLLAFLASKMERRRVVMYILAGALGAASVVCLVAQAGGYVPWADSLPVYAAATALIAGLVLAILEGVSGNRFYRLFDRLLLAGGVIFAVAVISSALARGAWWRELQEQWFVFLQNGYPSYFLHIARVVLVGVCSVSLGVSILAETVRRNVDVKVMRERLSMTEQSVAYLRAQARETAMAQHDMRRHLRVVGLYLEEGNADAALSYVNEIASRVGELPTAVCTGRSIVDLILNAEALAAREKGLSLRIRGAPLPDLPLTDSELASVLLNTIDNALAAAEKTPEGKVEIAVFPKDGFLCYTCVNSAPERTETERPRQGHGYGLRIVEELTAKKGGALRIARKDGRFEITIAIPLREPDSREDDPANPPIDGDQPV